VRKREQLSRGPAQATLLHQQGNCARNASTVLSELSVSASIAIEPRSAEQSFQRRNMKEHRASWILACITILIVDTVLGQAPSAPIVHEPSTSVPQGHREKSGCACRCECPRYGHEWRGRIGLQSGRERFSSHGQWSAAENHVS